MNYNLPYQTVAERKVVYEELLKHVDCPILGHRYLCWKLYMVTGGDPDYYGLSAKELVSKTFPELSKIIKIKLTECGAYYSLPHKARLEVLKEAIAECERILIQTTSKS